MFLLFSFGIEKHRWFNWLSLKKTIIKYCFDSFGKLRKLVVTLSLISRSKMNFDKRGLRFTFYYQLD